MSECDPEPGQVSRSGRGEGRVRRVKGKQKCQVMKMAGLYGERQLGEGKPSPGLAKGGGRGECAGCTL